MTRIFNPLHTVKFIPITLGKLIPEEKILCTSLCVKIWMNSGVSASIIQNSFEQAKKLNTKKTSPNKWSIMAGSILKSCEAKEKTKFSELNVKA